MREKPKTPVIYAIGNTTLLEHDAVCAWYDERLAASEKLSEQRSAEAAHWEAKACELQSQVDAMRAPTVPPSYKGVTYREGAWWYHEVQSSTVSALVAVYCDTFTDADHAPLLALRDAKPRELRSKLFDVLYDVHCKVTRLDNAADAIISLVRGVTP